MNLVARLILETGGFVRPAEAALGPLQRVKRELADVAREADKLDARRGGAGGSAAPLLLGPGGTGSGLAAGAAPAVAALSLIRSQTVAVATEMRRAAAPVMEFRRQLLALREAGGGSGGGRSIINVTGTAGGGGGGGQGGGPLLLGGGAIPPKLPGPDIVSPDWFDDVGRSAARAFGPVAAFYGAIRAGRFALGAASEMEDFTVSFTTLLGSAEAAQQRMGELTEFAAATPFELSEVTKASRVLETLTRGALSTGDGLRMVGDVAANTGQPFSELAMWIGRTYDGLQSGRPIGEALMRLQELGVMSGTARTEIERLQAEGRRGNAVWSVAAAEFGRFAGEMERRSATLSGRWSNLTDAAKMAAVELMKPWMPGLTEDVKEGSEALDTFATSLRENVAAYTLLARVAANPLRLGVDLVRGLAGDSAPAAAASGAGTRARRSGASGGARPPSVGEALDEFFGPLDALSRARDSVRDTRRAFDEARTQRILGDPLATDFQRTGALEAAGRRAFRESGITPDNSTEVTDVDSALRRVEAEIKMAQAQSRHREMAALSAQQLEKLVPVYEKLVSLAGQLGAIRQRGVDDHLNEFFGSLDRTSTTMRNGARAPQIPTDNLARVGLFVGAGGPALDYARRTAESTARSAMFLQKLADMPATAISRPNSSWGVQHG